MLIIRTPTHSDDNNASAPMISHTIKTKVKRTAQNSLNPPEVPQPEPVMPSCDLKNAINTPSAAIHVSRYPCEDLCSVIKTVLASVAAAAAAAAVVVVAALECCLVV